MLFVLEGVDCSGKTTALKNLNRNDTFITQEPFLKSEFCDLTYKEDLIIHNQYINILEKNYDFVITDRYDVSHFIYNYEFLNDVYYNQINVDDNFENAASIFFDRYNNITLDVECYIFLFDNPKNLLEYNLKYEKNMDADLFIKRYARYIKIAEYLQNNTKQTIETIHFDSKKKGFKYNLITQQINKILDSYK